MFLRRLLIVLGPPILCVLACALFRWLDGLMPAGDFFLFVVKGLTLGACLALCLPIAGLSVRSTGQVGFLWAAAGLLLLALAFQYLDTVGVLRWPVLRATLGANGQVVLVESAAMGYLALTAALYARRKRQRAGMPPIA